MQNPETVMFPGKETANMGYPTQWALNPSAYQNMDASQVDWASLAQQWIAMKEAAAIVSAEAPPPPPSSKPDDEAGEAPMEVENNDGEANQWNSSESWGNNDWNQWGWGWTGSAGLEPKVPMDPAIVMSPMMDSFPASTDDTTAVTGYATSQETTGPTFQHGYWTAPQMESSSRPATDRKKKESKTNNRGSRSHREKIPLSVPPVVNPIAVTGGLPGQTLDAAKRRQLPLWIREGLEKMEREKQRAIEREQENLAREEAEKEKKKREEEELARLKAEASGLPMIPQKSKFESDSEPEELDKEETVESARERLSPDVEKKDNSPPQQPLVQKSKEEIMQEVMFAVRRSLTEILLEVTDQEIVTVSQEELARYNAAQATRLNAMKASKSKALAAITSGLGLGAYESSSEGSEDEPSNDELSDQQLQDIIKRKRSAFETTSREIEAEVRRAERREAGEESDGQSPEREQNKTPVSRRESSGTPPPINSKTPDKVIVRRVSKEKKVPTKSNEKLDDHRKEHASIDKNKKKRDSTPIIKHNNKDTTSSSSDSADTDDSSSSISHSSDSNKRNSNSRKSKKRKRKNSSDSDSRRSKRHKKDKTYKYDEKESKSKHDKYDDYKEKSRSKRREDEKSHKSRSHKDRYRDDSEDDKYSRRRRSRSGSYSSRSGRRRSKDRSSRSDKYDRYERSRDHRRRSRTSSRHRR